MSRRMTWRRAIASTPFPVGLRPVKATLLALPVDVDGGLTGWRDEIAAEVGLPIRTLDRHLARAVDAGWLRHVTHGGHGRRSTYTVQIPDDVARQQWQATDRVARHVVRATTPSCAPRGGGLNKEHSANVSEHVAVDLHRQRRGDHKRPSLVTTTSAPTSRPAADLFVSRRCVCGGLRTERGAAA